MGLWVGLAPYALLDISQSKPAFISLTENFVFNFEINMKNFNLEMLVI